MITHSTRQLTYSRESKMFVGERSLLTMGGRNPLDGQIYVDACDAGFSLISHITGKTVAFSFKEDLRDADNDVYASVYAVVPEAVRKNPALAGLTVHVLNT